SIKMNPKSFISLLMILLFISVASPACNQTSTTCNYQTTCKCPASLSQGTYCGGDVGCDKTHVYECNPNGGECTTCDYCLRFSCAQCGKLSCPAPTQPKPSIPPSPTKPPTKPPSTPPQSLPSSICIDMTVKNFLVDTCVFLATPVVSFVILGATPTDIIATCVAAAAPFALETLGGSEALCAIVAFLATEAVAA
ncbi:29036_t:CDS:2, partial [Racocetra persica]